LATTLPQTKQIKYEFLIDPSCPDAIYTDITVVFSSLLGLLSNSIQAIESSGTINIIIASPTPNQIKITVTDSGCGVDPAIQHRLFIAPISKNGKNGIGLISIQKHMDTINGKCTFEPSTEPGACFCLHFPNENLAGNSMEHVLHEPSSYDPPAPLNRDEEAEDIPFFRSLKPRFDPLAANILVVDDAQAVRTLFRGLFKKFGILRVDVAENGKEALKKLTQNEYDVIFMDFLMPVMNGLECTKAYRAWEKENRANKPKAVIVGMSANAVSTDIRVIENLMQGFLQKPSNFAQVIKIVQFHDYLREDSKLKVVIPPTFFSTDTLSADNDSQSQEAAISPAEPEPSSPAYLLLTILIAFVSFLFLRYT